ncbi:MAG: cysteine hydrolase [Chloroflexi bacterium]|jgi:ureidoacrylate peracid hydrolase|nr:cysteine hydrolase [Chloroflexota bacterium]MBT7081263.1 cysteine hydrolase [Chloroflexota bacterium]MBT7288902.1 cysteine hydrolase [Chloroflexota bacterium]
MEVLSTLDQKIAPEHTAIVVIDMQNDFCDPKGFVAAKRGTDLTDTRAIIPGITKLLDKAREVKTKVILVQMSTTDDDLTGPIMDRLSRINANERSCPQGSWGAQLIPEIKPAPDDIIIYKTRYSAFIKTGLEEKLKEMGIKTLIVTGVATNVCVESTVRDGYMLDFYMVVPQDLVACAHKELQDVSMKNLAAYFATITDSDEVLKALG